LSLSRWFAASSLLFLGVLAVSPVKNALRPYRALQREYRRLGVARAASVKAAATYQALPAGIQQIWLPAFDDRVDRCTTCHLGVADAAMGGAREPFTRHSLTAHTPGDFERFGCTSCHGGLGLATSQRDAHGEVAGGEPMLTADHLEAGCGRCHDGTTVAEAPILSRGRSLMERFNCYACHEVRGHHEFRSEAPPLDTLALKTGGGWLRRWLTDPRAIDPNTTMPNFQLPGDEILALSHYLFSRPVPAELANRIRLAAAEPAGDPASGKKLFSESRCVTCHTVEGKGNGSAPELSKVASAASRGWLLAFVRDPQAFHAITRMPRFPFSASDSRDVVAYIEDQFVDFEAPKGMLEPLRVNQTLAEKGEKLFRTRGCVACHGEPGALAASGESGAGAAGAGSGGEKFGPGLDGMADRRAAGLDFGRRTDLPRTVQAWLTAKVNAPRSFAAGLRMPAFAFSPQDTRAVVTALLSLGSREVPPAYRAPSSAGAAFLPAGEVGRLISSYRCLSCHLIGGEGRDVSTAPLTFEGSKVKREWLVSYLVAAYSLRPALEERMPVFHMPRADAVLLADAIESFYVNPAIPEDPRAGRPAPAADAAHPTAAADAAEAAEGQRLYTTLGCRGCHILGSAGGYVGPPLTDTSSRLKPGWIYYWLKGPQRWRADVRCPDFGLSDTDALRLTAYLGTLKAPAAATAPAAGAPPPAGAAAPARAVSAPANPAGTSAAPAGGRR
jgi:mono/diheme cytochrome c family protein